VREHFFGTGIEQEIAYIDIVHGKIQDDISVPDLGREEPHPPGIYRYYVSEPAVFYQFLQSLHDRIETLDMTDADTDLLFTALRNYLRCRLDRVRDRFFYQDIYTLLNARKRDLPVQGGRHGDRDRVDLLFFQQPRVVWIIAAFELVRDLMTRLHVGIRNRDKIYAVKFRIYPGMMLADIPNAYYRDMDIMSHF
jgi:hypothetical protein